MMSCPATATLELIHDKFPPEKGRLVVQIRIFQHILPNNSFITNYLNGIIFLTKFELCYTTFNTIDYY